MKRADDTLTRVFARYNLSDPVPEDAQAALFTSRERVLINVLKTTGTYALFAVLISKIIFKGMGWGIKISLFKAKIILITGLAFTGATVTTGGYITYKTLIKKSESRQKEMKKSETKTKAPDIQLPQNNKISSKANPGDRPGQQELKPVPKLSISYRIGMQPLTITNDKSAFAKQITDILYSSLHNAAPKHIIRIEKNNSQQVFSLVVGSINKNNDTYTLILKLVDVQTSDVLWGTVHKFTKQNRYVTCNQAVIELVNHLNSKQ